MNPQFMLTLRCENGCNLKCNHCFEHGNNIFKNEIPRLLDFFQKNEHFIKTRCDDIFYIHGGEPLLSPMNDLLQLIRFFKKCNKKIYLISNLCVYLTPDHIAVLNHLDQLRTSFDISIRFMNIHNLLLWKSNVLYLRNTSHKSHMVVSLTNILIGTRSISNILEFAFMLGFTSISFELLIYQEITSILTPSNEQILAWFEKLKIYEGPYIEIVNNLKFRNFQDCCKKTLVFGTSGKIYNCIGSTVDTALSIDDSIESIISYKNNMKHRPAVKCFVCENFDTCKGSCLEYSCMTDEPCLIHLLSTLIDNYNTRFGKR